jgi:capsular polysaccharide biosynthesis protein
MAVLPHLTEAAYAEATGAPRDVLCEPERIEGPPPLMFPRPPADFYGDEPLSYDAPAVTLTIWRDIVVRGRSNVLTTPRAILRHGLVDPETDVTPEEFYGRLGVFPDLGRAHWAPLDPFNVDYLPEAAVFTDGTSFNYAHWMTEVLPRIAVFTKAKGSSRIPLIVDTELHPNIARSLALVAGLETPIYELAPAQALRVGVLHNVSPAGYVAFKLRPGAPRRATHGLFASQPLREMVGRLHCAVGARASRPRSRLLVRRNADLRQIVNQAEIDTALEARGFTVIDPGAMTLDEQVRVYSEAAMVVGGTGSAIVNLIFGSPQYPTVVMIPKLPAAAFWYWRRIAAAAGAGPVLHVVGDLTEPLADPFDPQAAHKDFRIAVKDVLDAVDAAEALGSA